MANKAEHTVQSYAAGVGGLGAWGLRALVLGAWCLGVLGAMGYIVHIGVNDGRKRIN